jgi:Nucleoside-diphosphate-sugar pyrophosphorylase involved in lipopolysaccharide biosynthesis/translation initiation factor 2B, gamma/epsilon subunits (eIF-2Bgamma/eIF-2Bepsilon)
MGDIIRTIMMAGGKGTRLRPLTLVRPKPMIPLVNKPIIEYTVNKLKKSGFDDIIMTLNYMSTNIKNYFKDGSELGIDIRYSVEKWPLGTGGSVKKAEKYIDDTFMVVSGDVLTDVDFNDVVKFHKEKGAIATMVLTEVEDPTHFGIAVMDRDNKITEYLEKPSHEEAFSSVANTGIYIFEPEIFDFFDDKDKEVDFSKDIFPEVIKQDSGIYGYTFDGYWNDIGRPETYLEATYDILDQKTEQNYYKTKMEESIGKIGNIWVGENVSIDEKARIEGPVVIGNNCTIEEGCKISRGSVIGDNVSIGKDVNIDGAVLFPNSIIEDNSFLNGCIIDTKCLIDKNTVVENGVVTGSLVEIGRNSIVRSSRSITNNMKIVPNSIIDSDYVMEAK